MTYCLMCNIIGTMSSTRLIGLLVGSLESRRHVKGHDAGRQAQIETCGRNALGGVALITISLPSPGGSANKVEDGIVSWPALEGAWQ